MPNIFDRYLLKSFLAPLTLCFAGLLGIWFIIDLTDNGPDFIQGSASMARIGSFYLSQFPVTILLLAPVALLLATLYCLGKLSKSNELISMHGAGRSLYRLLAPLIALGVFTSLLSMALNFSLVPKAEGEKDPELQAIKEGGERPAYKRNFLFVNSVDHRSWLVKYLDPFNREQALIGVEVRQYDESGNLKELIIGRKATYFPYHKGWRFFDPKHILFENDDPNRPFTVEKFPEEGTLDIVGVWNEDPWIIFSSGIQPSHMTLSQLTRYIHSNLGLPPEKLAPYKTEWHQRFAIPWKCLVVVLIACPLAIVYSRRGFLGGISSALLIFFALMFFEEFFISMGYSHRIPAFFAAWGPNLIIGGIGIFLLRFRAQNRTLPRILPHKLVDKFTG